MPQQNLLVQKKRGEAALALKQGRLDEAARLLEQCCMASPGDTGTWVQLASIQGQLGDLEGAEASCRRSLANNPGHPLANSILGNILALKGSHTDALEFYRRAQQASPNDTGILNNLGNALYLAGELEEAAGMLERATRLKPDFADAHNNLGNIYKAMHKNSEAIQHFQRALALNPGLFETLLNLGNIYSDRVGFPQAAEECFRKALELRPGSIEAESGLANMLRFQGRLDDSLALIRTAISKRPEDHSALAGEADILERMGRHDEAYAKVRNLLSLDPGNAMAVDVLTRMCSNFNCCDEAIRLGEALTSSNKLSDAGQQTLHFSLGKLHDKLGNYDNAFEHYRRGNAINSVPFEAAGYQKTFGALIKNYSREALDLLPKAGNGDSRPVFIIGMPRSGTSLTEQILASHPEVYGAGELNNLNDIAAGLCAILGSSKVYPSCIAELNQMVADQLASRYLDHLDDLSAAAPRITDKMPHNFVNLGLIALLFPKAHIIHCKRDPRDTCLSIYFQSFGWLHPYATDLSNLGLYYRLYDSLMQHWESVIDLPMLTVNYEEMVTDQERISRELVDFIGLDWDDRCLQFHESTRTVATASYDQVRQPMYRKSMARWQHYEEHIGPLIEALGDVLSNE